MLKLKIIGQKFGRFKKNTYLCISNLKQINMKLIQVYNQDEEQFLLQCSDELQDELIEVLIRESSEMEDEDEAERFLSENGIERTFIDVEIYL